MGNWEELRNAVISRDAPAIEHEGRSICIAHGRTRAVNDLVVAARALRARHHLPRDEPARASAFCDRHSHDDEFGNISGSWAPSRACAASPRNRRTAGGSRRRGLCGNSRGGQRAAVRGKLIVDGWEGSGASRGAEVERLASIIKKEVSVVYRVKARRGGHPAGAVWGLRNRRGPPAGVGRVSGAVGSARASGAGSSGCVAANCAADCEHGNAKRGRTRPAGQPRGGRSDFCRGSVLTPRIARGAGRVARLSGPVRPLQMQRDAGIDTRAEVEKA